MLYVIVKVFFKYANQEKKEFKKISVQMKILQGVIEIYVINLITNRTF
jgi:hypothetical protein